MKKIHSKLKALEWSQYFSHYKSIGIFLNAQGQITLKSLVGSCWISNPSKILWVYLLPERMKKTQSKMKELEWSQHYSLIFSDAQGQLTPKLMMESCRNSNPSKLLWLVFLSARMKKIHPSSSPMGKDRSPWSQHNVWRYQNLRCSKADNSELKTVTRN